MPTPESLNLNQVLRLTVGAHQYKGMVVNISDEAILVATTSKEGPECPVGTTVQGELFKPDGLYQFTSRLVGFQLMPVLVLILDRPKAIRRIQRRREPRHPVMLKAQLIFISVQISINIETTVSNVSFGGLELLSEKAPPTGYHCVVILRKADQELSTICQLMHAEKETVGYRLGMSFVEMSRQDLENLHAFVSEMDRHDS